MNNDNNNNGETYVTIEANSHLSAAELSTLTNGSTLPIKSGNNCTFGEYCTIPKGSVLEVYNTIGPNSIVGEGTKMGEYADIQYSCELVDGCQIGANSRIANGCKCGDNLLVLENVTVGDYCEFGESCNFCMGGRHGENCTYGSNLYIFKTTIGKGSKIGDMATISDSTLSTGLGVGKHAVFMSTTIMGCTIIDEYPTFFKSNIGKGTKIHLNISGSLSENRGNKVGPNVWDMTAGRPLSWIQRIRLRYGF